MAQNFGPISYAAPSTSGLILHVDASNSSSYSGTGTTWTDLSGSGNNMTIAGAPTYTLSSGLGYFTFPGSEITKYMILNPFAHPTNTSTITAWARFDSTYANSGATLFSYEVTGAANNHLLFNPSNITVFAGSISPGIATVVNVKNSTWTHLAVTSNRTTGYETLYVNGALTAVAVASVGTNFTTAGSLVLGQEQDSQGGGFDPGQSFKGDISSFKVFNRVLSDREVAADYLYNKARFGL